MLEPVVGQSLSAEEAEDLAVDVAKRGHGFVSPNPLVGCVIVDQNHRFLALGHHAFYGGPHAEVEAFSRMSSQQMQGSTVYVTLEPCSHHGKTPPCVDLFMDRGIAKVVVGHQDPNPLVAGRGIERLRQNQIVVEQRESFQEKCAKLAEIFLWHIQKKQPFVALKVAISRDGKIAGKPGDSIWITGESSRHRARQIRAQYDATMIGAETFLKDNPWLDYRQTAWEGKKAPKVVLLDPRGRARDFFPRSRMSKVIQPDHVYYIQSVNEKTLKDLYQNGLYSLYVEGGAITHDLFISQGLFQKIYCFQSSQNLGEGLSWRGMDQLNDIIEDLRLKQEAPLSVGEDTLFELYPVK